MNFTDAILPPSLLWSANALAVPLVAHILYRAPWRRLAQPKMQHVWLGTVVALMLAWSIKAGIKPGLDFHLLGCTLITLMFGPWLALAMLLIVLLGVTLSGAAGWVSFGLNFMVMALLPVLLSFALFRLADSRLPNHFFIFVFVDAFLGAGLAMVACGLCAALILNLAGAYTGQYLGAQYLPYFILMGWAEAMVTGMLITLLVVYRPDWVSTFSDERYLKSH